MKNNKKNETKDSKVNSDVIQNKVLNCLTGLTYRKAQGVLQECIFKIKDYAILGKEVKKS